MASLGIVNNSESKYELISSKKGKPIFLIWSKDLISIL